MGAVLDELQDVEGAFRFNNNDGFREGGEKSRIVRL
jgi:hypothetical protein